MKIGAGYKIESDKLNFILYKKFVSRKTGKESWRVEGYFSTIKNALHYLVEHEVKLTRDFLAVSEKQEELHTLISNLTIP